MSQNSKNMLMHGTSINYRSQLLELVLVWYRCCNLLEGVALHRLQRCPRRLQSIIRNDTRCPETYDLKNFSVYRVG